MISCIIVVVTCLAMIACILFKPQLRIRKWEVNTYWPVAFCGAVVMVASGQIDLSSLGQAMTANSSINPLKILILFLSMTMLSIFLDEVGFFRYLAHTTLSLAKQSQLRLFVILYLTVSVLTVFTSNDIIVLTFTPFICYFSKNAKISAVPYLVAEFIAANTMSMMLIIGNPTNIYIATSYQIGFFEYTRVMVLPTFAASLMAFFLLWMIFRKELKKPVFVESEPVVIRNKPFLIIGLIDLVCCTVILAVGSYIGLEMWIVALIAALALFAMIGTLSLAGRKPPVELKRTLCRAPWQLVPFVLSMFTMILAVSQNGVTEWINNCFGQDHLIWKYGVSSFLSANLINNIPMSVLFCPIIQPLTGGEMHQAVYATIVGSNIGAYLTPIGALAGIMWMSMLKQHQVKFSFVDFIRYGVAISVPTLLTNLLVLSFLF